MTTRESICEQLDEICTTELKKMTHVLFVKSGKAIDLFGKYRITKQTNRVVTLGYDIEFPQLTTAVAWCILHHHGLIQDAIYLQHYAEQMNKELARLDHFNGLISNAKDWDFKEVIIAKRSETLHTAKVIGVEIDKKVRKAKYMQTQGFTHETSTIIEKTNRRRNSSHS